MYVSISFTTSEEAKKSLIVLFGITLAAFATVRVTANTVDIAKNKPIKESSAFKNGNGNKTTLKKPPIMPKMNIPNEAPKMIKLKFTVGLNKNE